MGRANSLIFDCERFYIEVLRSMEALLLALVRSLAGRGIARNQRAGSVDADFKVIVKGFGVERLDGLFTHRVSIAETRRWM